MNTFGGVRDREVCVGLGGVESAAERVSNDDSEVRR